MGGTPRMCCRNRSLEHNIVAKFTASGTLTVVDSGCGVSADYLVVAGGGSGGPSLPGAGRGGGGGGGAGGYRSSGYGPSPLQGSSLSLAKGKYSVTIGAGGASR